MDTNDASPPASPASTAATPDHVAIATSASIPQLSDAPEDSVLAANGLESSEDDSDNDDHRGRKRRRLRRRDAPSSPRLHQLVDGDYEDDEADEDDFVARDETQTYDDGNEEQVEEEVEDEIVDELDIEEREKAYFSEDDINDEEDGEDLVENAEL